MPTTEEKEKRKTSCNKRRNPNIGRLLPENKVQELYFLAKNGYSNSKIAKELGVCRKTVIKYLKQNSGTPQTRAHATVAPLAADGSDYRIDKSLGAAIGLINTTKNHFIRLAIDGALPNVVTPLYIKQLIEAERMILTLPQDINKGRRDLYEQINGRVLEDSDTETTELASAGEMG